jgi:hypothetical protein
MKCMVIVKATQSSEAGAMPSHEMLEAMEKFNDELRAAGILLSCDGLQPTSKAARVHFSGDNRTVSNGPFNDSNEIAGYWLWEVQSMEQAIEWVKRCPNPMPEKSNIDIRPIFEAEDLRKATAQENPVQEQQLHQKIAGKK